MESRIKSRLLYIALAVIMMMEVFFTGNVKAEKMQERPERNGRRIQYMKEKT